MTVALKIPKHQVIYLRRFMGEHETDQHVVLFDFEVDRTDAGCFRFDMDVAFRPRYFVVRKGNREELRCMGASGVHVIVRADHVRFKEQIKTMTQPSRITVKHNSLQKRTRKHGFRISPEIKLDANGVSTTTPSLQYEREKGESRDWETSFDYVEHDLDRVIHHDVVEWILISPLEEAVVKKWLMGNLYLFMEFEEERSQFSGKIQVLPLGVAVYDPSGREVSPERTLLSLFAIWKDPAKPLRPNRYNFVFSLSSG